MSAITAYSTETTIDAAVKAVAGQLASAQPKLVIYFASSNFPAHEMAAAMQTAFSGIAVLGCTTAGEIGGGMMFKNSLVAMALGDDIIEDLTIAVIDDVQQGDGTQEAVQALADYFGKKPLELDPAEYVGLILFDGLSGAEENINDKIGNLTNVFFVGGSAGDDLKFEQTFVFAKGQALSNVAVLALIKPAVPFDIIKTQSAVPTGQKFEVTEVIESARTVVKLNGKPATEVYAQAVGCPVDQIGDLFMRYPFGLMAGDEPFIRSPQQPQDDRIVFYCGVKEGLVLDLMETKDMVDDTRAAIEAKQAELGGIQGIIVFNCILRTLQLESEDKTEAFGKVFADYPAIGFSTYGESFIGHINQTATMLVFGTR